MKKLALFLVLFVVTSSLFSQKSTHPDVKKGECYSFSGSIGDYPITMILEVVENEVSGRYYYHKIGTAIEFKGASNDSGYTLETLYGGDTENEKFILSIFHNELMGQWQKQNKSLSVSLSRFTNPISIYEVHKTIKPNNLKNTEDMREAHIQFRVLWPEDASPESQKIREQQFSLINSMQFGAEDASAVKFNVPIDPRTIQGNPSQLISQLQIICNYISDDFAKEINENTESGFGNRDLMQISSIEFDSERFKVISNHAYEYNGGAHGMFGTSHITWDKSLNKWAVIDDYFSKKQQKKIPSIMTTQYKIQHGIPSKDKLSLHGLWIESFTEIGGDVYFTDLGLTTSFGLYEIAPYSEGIISVFVPW